jgi:hypothetical protein
MADYIKSTGEFFLGHGTPFRTLLFLTFYPIGSTIDRIG